jgi:hypothetical protein
MSKRVPPRRMIDDLHRVLLRYKRELQPPNQTALRALLTDLSHLADLHPKISQQQQQLVQQQQGSPVRGTCHARNTVSRTTRSRGGKKRGN